MRRLLVALAISSPALLACEPTSYPPNAPVQGTASSVQAREALTASDDEENEDDGFPFGPSRPGFMGASPSMSTSSPICPSPPCIPGTSISASPPSPFPNNPANPYVPPPPFPNNPT